MLHRTDYPFRLGAYINGWYASTLSDPPSRWGYVPEVYFRGGNNWEHDAGLHIAGPGIGGRYCT